MNRKGFTLIEILVVVAIIGILAGIVIYNLTKPKEQATDVRRAGDLRQVQTSLEIYYNKKGSSYPIASTWADLKEALAGADANLGIRTIPQDPKNVAPYVYEYLSDGTTYILKATLQDKGGNLVKDDIDEVISIGTGSIDCGIDGPDEVAYCLGN